jgi:transcriptional regulator with XRE-family HTH domain
VNFILIFKSIKTIAAFKPLKSMDIGNKIKTLRLQCSLTQEDLADRCNLTKGYISQLENNLTSPSIETLKDILAALGTSLKQFFSEEIEEKVVYRECEFIAKTTDGMKFIWLVPDSQKNMMEPAVMNLKVNAATTQDFPHDGEEFGYVLEGDIRLHLGTLTYDCAKGEAFYYKCDRIHYIENTGKRTA